MRFPLIISLSDKWSSNRNARDPLKEHEAHLAHVHRELKIKEIAAAYRKRGGLEGLARRLVEAHEEIEKLRKANDFLRDRLVRL